MARRILTILGHPRSASLCGAISDAFAAGAASAGADVRSVRIAELDYSLRTPPDYETTNLEPELAQVQESLYWADHIALVYPIWWGSSPGQLGILLERTLLPGFAFKYHPQGLGWDRLLAGRTGELLVTMDTPPFFYKWVYGAAGDRIMARRTLDFCGVKPVRATHFGPVRKSTPDIRGKWLMKAQVLGRTAAG